MMKLPLNRLPTQFQFNDESNVHISCPFPKSLHSMKTDDAMQMFCHSFHTIKINQYLRTTTPPRSDFCTD